MDWVRFQVRTTTMGAELVTGILMDLGIQGAMIEDKGDFARNQRPEGQWDILDESLMANMDEDVIATAYVPDDARAADTLAALRTALAEMKTRELGFDAGKLELSVSSVDDEDWAENWKSRYAPFRLGKRFVVRPSWTKCETSPEDLVIELDPGLAFGTGTHETTAMCVGLVEQYVKPGDDVIDVGTGSGILAIAAAMVGAGDVLAIDLDAMAVRVAKENIKKNRCEGTVRAVEGDLLKSVSEVADVVVANIIADVIVMLAAPVRAHIKEGGFFICSGIARERAGEVISALEEAGYRDLDVRERGEWAAVAARR